MLKREYFMNYGDLVEEVIMFNEVDKDMFKEANKNENDWVLIGEEKDDYVVLYNKKEKKVYVQDVPLRYLYEKESNNESVIGYIEVNQMSFGAYIKRLNR